MIVLFIIFNNSGRAIVLRLASKKIERDLFL